MVCRLHYRRIVVMNLKSTPRAIGLALMLWCLAAAASAQNAPGGPSAAAPPVPDPGTTPQLDCIAESGRYTASGKRFAYVIALENKCERRIKCTVFAYVVQAKGPSSGSATVILAPKSQGAAAKKSHALAVRMIGGITQTTRECRVF
jgi:hypothetical protein